MESSSIYPDLPENGEPVRIETQQNINKKMKMKMKFIHMKKGNIVKVKGTTKAEERMKKHRLKPGVR